jgi:hypothetical protein
MYLGTEPKGCYHNSNPSQNLWSNTENASHNIVCLWIYGNETNDKVTEKNRLFQNMPQLHDPYAWLRNVTMKFSWIAEEHKHTLIRLPDNKAEKYLAQQHVSVLIT